VLLTAVAVLGAVLAPRAGAEDAATAAPAVPATTLGPS
jgi:hypothetical protein